MRGSSVTVRPVRSVHLILVILLITLVAQILVQLRLAAVLAHTFDFVLVWFLILLNFAIAIAGWWTAQRVAWTVYLLLSVAGLVLIGAATPLAAVLLLRQYWWG